MLSLLGCNREMVFFQLKGSGAELSRRVQNLLTISRVQANAIGGGGSVYLPGSTKIHEQSLADMQEVRVVEV